MPIHIVVRRKVEVLVSRMVLVIRHASPWAVGVTVLVGIHPRVGPLKVLGYSEPQPLAKGGVAELAGNVTFGNEIHSISPVMLGIPKVVVVMVDVHRDEIHCFSGLVFPYSSPGIEDITCPHRDNVFITELGRVAVVFGVEFISLVFDKVHVLGIPITGVFS
ncbi:MAG: hypothetical protein AAGA25_16610 [Planctomycetota bacterium]